ncbi:MAG: efflux transporter outer membrane subunit [Pyrinomonadaceae bacterium]|nr:efflux transporter outer membrane subunit [Phycisphaerales bacterium]
MNRLSRVGLTAIGVSGALLHGCTVGPNHVPPSSSAPEAWAESLEGGVAATPADLSRWWTNFGDETLDGLVVRAIAGNHDLRSAMARVREARALRTISGAGQYPAIDATGSYGNQLRSENIDNGFANENPAIGGIGAETEPTDLYAIGFDASWELDLFGHVRRSVEAADADLSAAEESRRDVLVSLLAELARNYVDLRSLQSRLDIAQRNVASQEDTLSLADSRFKGGLTSELDVVQARSNVERTRSQIPSLQSSIRQTQHRLAVLTGLQPGSLAAQLDGAKPVPVPPSEIAVGLPSELVRRRPDIRRAERELAAASARIGVATADLFPRFMLTGSVGLQSSPLGNLFDTNSFAYSIGPSVRWNVFDAGRVRANIGVQTARQEQLLAAYEKTVLVAFEEVENSLVAYSRELVRRGFLKTGTDAATRAVELATERYARGLTGFQDVLDAQRQLFALQDDLALSERSVTASVVSLYKALGGGWEQVSSGVARRDIRAEEPDEASR